MPDRDLADCTMEAQKLNRAVKGKLGNYIRWDKNMTKIKGLSLFALQIWFKLHLVLARVCQYVSEMGSGVGTHFFFISE